MEIGQVEAIFRYSVKSMAGERLEAAELGWHGLEGDRRLAFRRLADRSGFPWLTAGKLPELLLFAPQRREDRKASSMEPDRHTASDVALHLAEVKAYKSGIVELRYEVRGHGGESGFLPASATVDEP